MWFYTLVVRTLDFEYKSLSLNINRTFCDVNGYNDIYPFKAIHVMIYHVEILATDVAKNKEDVFLEYPIYFGEPREG